MPSPASKQPVRRSVAAGNPVSVELWNRTGGSERYDRRRRWWTDHSDQFAAALTYSAFVAVFPLLLPHVGATPRRKRSRSARATVPPKLTRPNDVCSSRRTAGLARASGSTKRLARAQQAGRTELTLGVDPLGSVELRQPAAL